ncbi:uncharacterized protein LOC143039721 [Oratosquilla oratoria]|uniref:uncharacterized protein LOC143039721 n=1 Tax=Oratosquilla oratoria TaxID=337810 RepID=UPI003F77510C
MPTACPPRPRHNPPRSSRAHSRALLRVTDTVTGCHFLVDTGAVISVVPPAAKDRTHAHTAYDLLAANGTPIATYGTRHWRVSFAPELSFPWTFVVADVGQPILGLDFLREHDILVDARRQRLIHRPSNAFIRTFLWTSPAPVLTHVQGPSPYNDIVREFPSITSSLPHPRKLSHTVEHTILTHGPPCFARPRRLPPERLQAAKQEFELLLQDGISHSAQSCHTPVPYTKRNGPTTFPASVHHSFPSSPPSSSTP